MTCFPLNSPWPGAASTAWASPAKPSLFTAAFCRVSGAALSVEVALEARARNVSAVVASLSARADALEGVGGGGERGGGGLCRVVLLRGWGEGQNGFS